jgi:hypothetical protein
MIHAFEKKDFSFFLSRFVRVRLQNWQKELISGCQTTQDLMLISNP